VRREINPTPGLFSPKKEAGGEGGWQWE